MDLDYAMRVGDPYLFRENTAEPDTLGGIICSPHERLVFETRRPPGFGHFLFSCIVALLFTARAINKDTALSTRKLTVSYEKRVSWRRCSYVSVYVVSHSGRCRRSIYQFRVCTKLQIKNS